MASVRKRGKVWYYRFVDELGRPVERRGCSDKRETERLGAAAEERVAKIREGILDPKIERMAEAARRPIVEHLQTFIDTLRNKNGDAKHVDQTDTYCRRILAMTGTKRIADLNASAVQEALATLKTHGYRDPGAESARPPRALSNRTVNAHATAIKSFSRWLDRSGRTPDDALVSVAKLNEEVDRRHDRRTLGLDELRRLIAAAQDGPIIKEMTGPARALCYRVAVATGLRFSEIASIVPRSFDFASEPPIVTVAAGYTKNGEMASFSLAADIAQDLRAWIVGMSLDSPIFRLPTRGAEMLRVDLAAAGIEYRDASGRVFDFHALRCQTATLADQAGCSPRTVQQLMRHSTLELTGRYTRPRAVDLEQAAASIPSLRPAPADSPEALRMTGTAPAEQPINEPLAHYLPITEDGEGRTVAATDAVRASAEQTGECGKPLELSDGVGDVRSETDAGGSAPRRTRTFNPLIKSQRKQSPKEQKVNVLRVCDGSISHHLPIDTRKTDVRLARVVDAWPTLPESTRLAIRALLDAQSDEEVQ